MFLYDEFAMHIYVYIQIYTYIYIFPLFFVNIQKDLGKKLPHLRVVFFCMQFILIIRSVFFFWLNKIYLSEIKFYICNRFSLAKTLSVKGIMLRKYVYLCNPIAPVPFSRKCSRKIYTGFLQQIQCDWWKSYQITDAIRSRRGFVWWVPWYYILFKVHFSEGSPSQHCDLKRCGIIT